jgi:hypothetical protein
MEPAERAGGNLGRLVAGAGSMAAATILVTTMGYSGEMATHVCEIVPPEPNAWERWAADSNAFLTTQPAIPLPALPTTQPTSQPTTQPTSRPTTRPTTQPTTRPATHPTTKPAPYEGKEALRLMMHFMNTYDAEVRGVMGPEPAKNMIIHFDLELAADGTVSKATLLTKMPPDKAKTLLALAAKWKAPRPSRAGTARATFLLPPDVGTHICEMAPRDPPEPVRPNNHAGQP